MEDDNVTENNVTENNDEIVMLQKEEHDIIMEAMPHFDMGIAEHSVMREMDIWRRLFPIFREEGILPDVKVTLVSDMQFPEENNIRPMVVCPGVRVVLTYVVHPIDKDGKSGRLSSEKQRRIGEIRQRISELESMKKCD